MKYLSWQKISETFDVFWRKHPALFTGFHILLAAAFAINFHFIFLFPLGLLWLSCKRIKWLISHLIILMLSFIYIKTNFVNYSIPSSGIQGEAIFSCESVSKTPSNFGYSLIYKGIIKNFNTDSGEVLKNLPCKIAISCNTANKHFESLYRITGTLKQKSPFSFILKPDKSLDWEPLNSKNNLMNLRYKTKNSLNTYLKSVIPDASANKFLMTLVSGDATDQMLFFNFNQLGLSHILAISGFHFAIVSLFFYAIFKRILSFKASSLITFILVTIYFIFLGSSASIQRAWLMISYILIGQVFEKPSNGLNALGLALTINLLIKPYDIFSLGFQLTFACTLAILLIYPSIEKYLQKLLPKRPKSTILKLGLLDLHGYILASLIRNSLAISLATNLLSIPIILLNFHKFPLAGLGYNLFFPWLVSMVIFIFLGSCIFPILGTYLHYLNCLFIKFVLLITENPPIKFLFALRTDLINLNLATALVSLIIFISIFIKEYSYEPAVPCYVA